MAESKSPGLPQRLLESALGGAIWHFVAWAIGALLASYGGVRLLSAPLAKVWYVAMMLIGLYLMGLSLRSSRWLKRKEALPATTIVAGYCSALLDAYKRLDHDYRDAVRYPLNRSSWPDYGKPWNYVDAELYKLQSQFMVFQAAAALTGAEMDLGTHTLFQVSKDVQMFDLINALERFLERLKAFDKGTH